MNVFTGQKKCGCLVAISFDQEYIDSDYIIDVMDLEEARARLKECTCTNGVTDEN